jgi:hypothetical protein
MFYEQDHMVVGYTYAIITEFFVFASRLQSMADHAPIDLHLSIMGQLTEKAL